MPPTNLHLCTKKVINYQKCTYLFHSIIYKSAEYVNTGGKSNLQFKGFHCRCVLRNSGVIAKQVAEGLKKRNPDTYALMLTHVFVVKELRTIFSIVLRRNTNEEELDKLGRHCTRYFRAVNLFGKVYNTAWIVGKSWR